MQRDKISLQPDAAESNGDAEEFPLGANKPPETHEDSGISADTPDGDNPYISQINDDEFDDLDGEAEAMDIACHKPDKTWIIRVHSDEKYRFNGYFLQLKKPGGDKVHYLLHPKIAARVAAHPFYREMVVKIRVYLATTTDGYHFLLPVQGPTGNEMSDKWSRSLRRGVEKLTDCWGCLASNKARGCYDFHPMEDSEDYGDPKWPNKPMEALMEQAFADEKLISDMEHPVLRQYRRKESS
jgi:hypothetical protein